MWRRIDGSKWRSEGRHERCVLPEGTPRLDKGGRTIGKRSCELVRLARVEVVVDVREAVLPAGGEDDQESHERDGTGDRSRPSARPRRRAHNGRARLPGRRLAARGLSARGGGSATAAHGQSPSMLVARTGGNASNAGRSSRGRCARASWAADFAARLTSARSRSVARRPLRAFLRPAQCAHARTGRPGDLLNSLVWISACAGGGGSFRRLCLRCGATQRSVRASVCE